MNAQVAALQTAGVNALKAGRADDAVKSLQMAAGMDPQNYDTYAFLGAAYARQSNNESSRRAFGKAVQLKPDSARARFNLGMAHEKCGNIDAARTCFEMAVQMDASYSQAQQALDRLPKPKAPGEMNMAELSAPGGAIHMVGAQSNYEQEEEKPTFVATSLTPEEIARLSMPGDGHLHIMGAQATDYGEDRR
jgi:tetratricopeptide (TPR) repeat protein